MKSRGRFASRKISALVAVPKILEVLRDLVIASISRK